MSRRRRSEAPRRSRQHLDDRLEAIALRLHQIAATLGLLAEGQDESNLSHTLYFIEQSVLDVEASLADLYGAHPRANGSLASLARHVDQDAAERTGRRRR
jgi:hypothetical protein